MFSQSDGGRIGALFRINPGPPVEVPKAPETADPLIPCNFNTLKLNLWQREALSQFAARSVYRSRKLPPSGDTVKKPDRASHPSA